MWLKRIGCVEYIFLYPLSSQPYIYGNIIKTKLPRRRTSKLIAHGCYNIDIENNPCFCLETYTQNLKKDIAFWFSSAVPTLLNSRPFIHVGQKGISKYSILTERF